MNLFEKIFNYQILSQLENTGTSVLTSQERAWLRTMLVMPDAEMIFSPATYAKLVDLLKDEKDTGVPHAIVEKAKSREKQLLHPHIRALRRIIAMQSAIRLTTRLKNGQRKEYASAFPYKLEFSMVKREWYLLWFNMRHTSLLSTKLNMIERFSELPHPLQPEQIEWAQSEISRLMARNKRTATIEIIRDYNQELSRILYAFSCFEKAVDYDEQSNRYFITLTYQVNEGEYVLSKMRFLGKRVKLVAGDYLRRRMLESAAKSLERYGEYVT